MAKLIAIGIRVCVQCLTWIANGETGDEADNAKAKAGVARILTYHEAKGGSVVPSGGDDEEGFFSWSECECCKDGLAGTRYLVGVIL